MPTRDVTASPYTRQEILELLHRHPRALESAMARLLERQTADERAAQTTRHHNGRGFSAFHARTGTMLGQYARSGGTFGPKWRRLALRIAIVHVGQLVEVANGRG